MFINLKFIEFDKLKYGNLLSGLYSLFWILNRLLNKMGLFLGKECFKWNLKRIKGVLKCIEYWKHRFQHWL